MPTGRSHEQFETGDEPDERPETGVHSDWLAEAGYYLPKKISQEPATAFSSEVAGGSDSLVADLGLLAILPARKVVGERHDANSSAADQARSPTALGEQFRKRELLALPSYGGPLRDKNHRELSGGYTEIRLDSGAVHSYVDAFYEPGPTDSNFSEYQGALFPEGSSAENRAFAAGNVVLDLGCGQARALREFARIHPNTTFLGIDLGYIRTTGGFRNGGRPQPGVDLAKDWWTSLTYVSDKSIHTVISVEGVGRSRHGLRPDSVNSDRTVQAVSRVTVPGAEWRFNAPADTTYWNYLQATLTNAGWEAQQLASQANPGQMTVVAHKTLLPA